MVSETEADPEGSSGADADQMKDSVRRRGASVLQRLLGVIRDIADSAGYVDCDEVAMSTRLELSLVSLFVDPFASVSDLLRGVEYVQIDRHLRLKTLPHNIQCHSPMPPSASPRSPRETVTLWTSRRSYNQPVRILGIDPGSVTTGFGVIEQVQGRLALIEQGTIGTIRGSELADRLCRIHDEMVTVIKRCAPDSVAVEAPFGGQNVKSLIQLAHARGVILLAARSAKLEVFEYSPRSVKSAVVGYGAAEKEQVAKMVRMLLPGCANLVMSTDASDALAVAICHAHTAGTAERLRIAR
jgi:crossover junction endodeoxyribonuclease RuvC